jgi:hypothetical protein
MKQYSYEQGISRPLYREIQVERSNAKFGFCRVSGYDAILAVNVLRNNGYRGGPVVCMGTRNGREIDLFRLALNYPYLARLNGLLEARIDGLKSVLRGFEMLGRSNVQQIQDGGVYGVDINPNSARRDTWIGSFDDLPADFDGRFEVLYSNSFDQSLDPVKTARAWVSAVRDGGFIVLHYVEGDAPTYTDPTGGLTSSELSQLFPGQVLHFSRNGNFDPSGNSTGIIIQIRK